MAQSISIYGREELIATPLSSPITLDGRILNGPVLIIDSEARRTLGNHIGWGQSTNANRVEQGGCMVGDIFEFNGSYFGLVRDFIPAATQGTSVSLDITAEMWQEMQAIAGGRNVIGWYHTHPEHGIFMSGTDMNTQRAQFAKDWQFALVANPHTLHSWGMKQPHVT